MAIISSSCEAIAALYNSDSGCQTGGHWCILLHCSTRSLSVNLPANIMFGKQKTNSKRIPIKWSWHIADITELSIKEKNINERMNEIFCEFLTRVLFHSHVLWTRVISWFRLAFVFYLLDSNTVITFLRVCIVLLKPWVRCTLCHSITYHNR